MLCSQTPDDFSLRPRKQVYIRLRLQIKVSKDPSNIKIKPCSASLTRNTSCHPNKISWLGRSSRYKCSPFLKKLTWTLSCSLKSHFNTVTPFFPQDAEDRVSEKRQYLQLRPQALASYFLQTSLGGLSLTVQTLSGTCWCLPASLSHSRAVLLPLEELKVVGAMLNLTSSLVFFRSASEWTLSIQADLSRRRVRRLIIKSN